MRQVAHAHYGPAQLRHQLRQAPIGELARGGKALQVASGRTLIEIYGAAFNTIPDGNPFPLLVTCRKSRSERNWSAVTQTADIDCGAEDFSVEPVPDILLHACLCRSVGAAELRQWPKRRASPAAVIPQVGFAPPCGMAPKP